MNPHPVAEVMPATVRSLCDRLEDMYWAAVKQEACNMIKFYNEIMAVGCDISGDDAALGSQTFRKLFGVWTGGQAKLFKGYDSCGLFRDVLERSRQRFSSDTPHRCARLVLQSSSLLDLDILHEQAFRLYPSYRRELPNVEEVHGDDSEAASTGNAVLRGVRCSRCGLLIRSPFYYECQSGCKDTGSAKLPSVAISIGASGKRKARPHRSVESSSLSNVRVCPQCCATGIGADGCRQRDHFRRKFHYQPYMEGKPEFLPPPSSSSSCCCCCCCSCCWILKLTALHFYRHDPIPVHH